MMLLVQPVGRQCLCTKNSLPCQCAFVCFGRDVWEIYFVTAREGANMQGAEKVVGFN